MILVDEKVAWMVLTLVDEKVVEMACLLVEKLAYMLVLDMAACLVSKSELNKVVLMVDDLAAY